MDDASLAPETAPSALSQAELDQLTDKLVEKLKTVFDPEIPVDIYELGLIYKVDVSDDKDVVIDMTLTAPGCPVAGEMPDWVREADSIVSTGNVEELVDAWTPERVLGGDLLLDSTLAAEAGPIPVRNYLGAANQMGQLALSARTE